MFNRDFPYHPYKNCYKSRAGAGPTAGSVDAVDCYDNSMQLFVQVKDAPGPGDPPMKEENLYLKASLERVQEALSIFSTDLMRVDFYIEKADGEGKPQSYVLSPATYDPSCRAFEAADEIECNNFNVYCEDPQD